MSSLKCWLSKVEKQDKISKEDLNDILTKLEGRDDSLIIDFIEYLFKNEDALKVNGVSGNVLLIVTKESLKKLWEEYKNERKQTD